MSRAPWHITAFPWVDMPTGSGWVFVPAQEQVTKQLRSCDLKGLQEVLETLEKMSLPRYTDVQLAQSVCDVGSLLTLRDFWHLLTKCDQNSTSVFTQTSAITRHLTGRSRLWKRLNRWRLPSILLTQNGSFGMKQQRSWRLCLPARGCWDTGRWWKLVLVWDVHDKFLLVIVLTCF